jgi:hypothetical protein
MKLYQEFAKDLNQLARGVHARCGSPCLATCHSRSRRLDPVETDTGWCPCAITANRTATSCVIPTSCFCFTMYPMAAAAEPVSFRNDYLGIVQDVYRYDETGRRTHVLPSLKQELKEFAGPGLPRSEDQGFFAPTAVREILSP